MECIFCKIVNKEMDAEIVYEDDTYLAFNDISPKMNTHILIIPKKHIERFHTAETDEDRNLVKWLFDVAWYLVDQKNLGGCNLTINSGSDHGQEVYHIHLHLMSRD